MEHKEELYPCPGELRAIICLDGKICKKVSTNPVVSRIVAENLLDSLEDRTEPCGPHKIVLYEPKWAYKKE